jgi:hypothetical protein
MTIVRLSLVNLRPLGPTRLSTLKKRLTGLSDLVAAYLAVNYLAITLRTNQISAFIRLFSHPMLQLSLHQIYFAMR